MRGGMVARLRPDWFRAGAFALALGLLGGCQTTGLSARDAEIARLRGDGNFSVLQDEPRRVLFSARGNRVAVEPPDGYCIDHKAIEVTENSAFVLISDCLDDEQINAANAAKRSEKQIDLPRSFPGLLTVTISGAQALGSDSSALDAFEALLASDAGRALLGRGNNGSNGKVIATRRSGGAVYVLIEEDSGASPIFAPRFWRGFIDINDRLVLVTVSSFSDRPIADDSALAFLATEMARLRKANGMPAVKDELEIAALLDLDRRGVAIARAERSPARAQAVASAVQAPAQAPVPAARYAVLASSRAGAAPDRAPMAPRRPG